MYRHYIKVDEKNRVTDGWSSGEHPGLGPGEGDTLLTDQGGVAFVLLGVEHPALFTDDKDKIPLYAYENGAARYRTVTEIDGDRPGPSPEPEPTEMERIEAQVRYTALMTDTLLAEEG